jgi:hypothetical protein
MFKARPIATDSTEARIARLEADVAALKEELARVGRLADTSAQGCAEPGCRFPVASLSELCGHHTEVAFDRYWNDPVARLKGAPRPQSD